MFLGREHELARLEQLLDDARGGHSRALIVYGDPGIGKTALLEAAMSRATGYTTLVARPLEVESELPFAGLADLLHPLLPVLARIPQPQADALSGALALGPPTPGDRFAAAVATMSLLAAGAEQSPLLTVVDDAHWLDTPSREALVYVARRLNNDRVMLLLAMRDRPWRSATRIDGLELGGLSAREASDLLTRSGKVISAGVHDRLVRATAGNPLALREALANLRDDQLTGSMPIDGPIAVGADLEASFARRMEPLSVESRSALLIAATSDTGQLAEVRRAIESLGLPPDSLEPAEKLRLIALTDNHVEFMHPLLRSAVYHLADPVEQRRTHRALASALPPRERDQIAWHLASATTGPDESVAKRLEESAATAQTRHGYSAAANALAAAARLSPDRVDHTRRMLNAANMLRLGGEPHASNAVLLGLLEEVTDPLTRADIQLVRSSALLSIESSGDAIAVLIDEAGRVEGVDAQRAASMLTMATIGAVGAADVLVAVEIAERAVRLSRPIGGPTQMVAELALGFALTLVGRVDEARSLLEPMLPMLDFLDPLGETGLVLATAAHMLVWMEDWPTATRIFGRIIRAARNAGAITILPHPLAVMAELEQRSGQIASAYSTSNECVEICLDIGEETQRAIALVCLARVEGLLGHADDCRRHVDESLDIARRLGVAAVLNYASGALGMLELSVGRPELAASHLALCSKQELDQGVGLPNAVLWNGDLIESYVRLGRIDDAERETARLEEQARVTGVKWAAAVAVRCRGLLADDSTYESLFRDAVQMHGEEDPYERARTQLCLGRRLRHSRRRADARAELQLALAQFESLGTAPWAEQTRLELRATGATPTTTPNGSLTSLTPQELHVALVVAGGATNKEAAASLFISTKTVEFHLSNVYRKLGIRSRTELARRAGAAGS